MLRHTWAWEAAWLLHQQIEKELMKEFMLFLF